VTSLPINSNYYKNKSEFLRTDDANKLPTFKRGRERGGTEREREREGPRERERETKKVSKCRPEEKVRKVWT
jgi:hypothetical protein